MVSSTATGEWMYERLGLAPERRAVARYGLEEALARANGRMALAQQVVAQLEAVDGPQGRSPGGLFAAAVLYAFMRALITRFAEEIQPGALARARTHAEALRSHEEVAATLEALPELFAVEANLTPEELLREATLLALGAANPALAPWRATLFNDAELERRAPYRRVVQAVEAWFTLEPHADGLGGEESSLFDALRAPLLAHPESLEAQLSFALDRWSVVLPDDLIKLGLRARDIMKEETRARLAGPGPSQALTFGNDLSLLLEDPEYESFTEDRDWMSSVVIIAKSTYVWLAQLTAQYGRPIQRLDAIPDAELDRLAAAGITGLWFIGIWERSCASRDIKRRMGDTEALSSAYALYDYVISQDVGGDEAWAELSRRAGERGIRLAADMVPNHVGMASRWVTERPDWFIQVPHSPYPNYTFYGPDLSDDPRVGVYLEDGYWNRSDAAVVFKRVDHATGEVRYLYHGNDGTQMPWNDTAQLDFLNPEVREAVIQQILSVARKFPIIRFDAAMVLARRHIRRLWHPAPGEGGAIPSRSIYGATPEEVDDLMPAEFWREVVDRVQAEVPDCLLLAEAFWMLEGYFVRTLGMHRVYNSAFMHMLRDEENAKYRETIRNVLEFSPRVIKRFVNFMNNPDEETAAEQFGKGDKYFGVATLLATLPGLPMIGHGQIEGFTEKYGMEYAAPRKDEQPDTDLIDRHRREIFPLLRVRALFSHSEHFALYDVRDAHGTILEDIFATTNRLGKQRALVLYNNRFERADGHLHTSTPYNVGPAEQPDLRTRTFAEALDLQADALYRFQEHPSGRWHLRTGSDLHDHGFPVHLQGYQARVFWRFSPIPDPDEHWLHLALHLGPDGAHDLVEARDDLRWAGRLSLLHALVAQIAALPLGADLDPEPWRARLLSLGVNTPDLTPLRAALDAEADAPDLTLRLAALAALLPPEALSDRHLRLALDAHLPAHLAAALAALRAEPDDLAALIDSSPAFLGVNTWDGVTWFNAEAMTALLDAYLLHLRLRGLDPEAIAAVDTACREALQASAWRVNDLLRLLPELPAP